MPVNPLHQQLHERAAIIASWDTDTLIKPKESGSWDFSDQKETFEVIVAFYKDVANSNLSAIPGTDANNILNAADGMIRILTQIKDYNWKREQHDPAGVIRNLSGSLQNQWRDVYQATAVHLGVARVTSAAFTDEIRNFKTVSAKLIQELQATVLSYCEASKSVQVELESKKTEIEAVLHAARQSAARSAVSAQASEFDHEAIACRNASIAWITATTFVVVGSLVTVYQLFLKEFHQPLGTATPANSPQSFTAPLVQQTLARVLVVTLLYSAVVWCARNYFASRHNYTVNRHRRNAMQTFRAFVEGTEDQATRDFILRQAAACAFSPQQSGYLKDESLPTPGPTAQILDFAKTDGKS
jgi:hypothetical protein